MRQLCYRIIILSLLLLPGRFAWAVERFPPPDFESGHQLPLTTTPAPRAMIYEYLDVAVLLAALSLAAYLVLKRRSRRAIFALMLFSLLYFGFWRKGCICPIGAVQNVTLAIFDSGYAIPVTVLLFFLLPLVFTLFFGRVFCAAVCPLGAIQDAVLVRPVRLPEWVDHVVGLLAYVYLGAALLFAATGSAFIICQYDPFVSFFRLTGGLNILILGGSLLLIGLFIGRPYCRFLCPYGVILRWFSRVSRLRVTITPNDCINCRLCEESCPFGAIQRPTTEYHIPPPDKERLSFVVLLVLLPVFMLLGGWSISKVNEPLARMHKTVRLAERVYLEENKQVSDTTDESDAFRTTGQPVEELYRQAQEIRRQYSWGGWLLGGFIGLVIGGKSLGLAVRRQRSSYEANPARCLACGRCYIYCPIERRKIAKNCE